MMKRRIDYLDIAKGIGILLMIFGHIDRGGIIQTWIYSFHMPLFFIVSGILFCKKNKNSITLKEDIIKKIKGLIYPYIVFSLVTIVYIFVIDLLISQNILHAFIQLKEGVIETILFFGYGNLWFIPCFFLSNIIFMAISRLRKYWILLFELIVFFIVFMVSINYPNGNTQFSFFTLSIKSLIGFLLIQLGFYLGKIIDCFELHNNYRNSFIALIISVVLHSILFIANGKRLVDLNTINIGNFLIYLLIAFSGTIMIVCLSILLEKIDDKDILKFYGGGKRSFMFLAVNNFTLVTAVSEKIVSLFFELNTYPYYFVVWIFVVLIESLMVMLIEKYLHILYDYDEAKKILNSNEK